MSMQFCLAILSNYDVVVNKVNYIIVYEIKNLVNNDENEIYDYILLKDNSKLYSLSIEEDYINELKSLSTNGYNK